MSKEQIEPMDWEEIMMNVGNPVYDKTEERWRVLRGYMETVTGYSVNFTDDWENWWNFQNKELYLNKV